MAPSAPRPWHLVFSILLLIAFGVGAIIAFLPGAMRQAAIEDAYRGNLDTAEQIIVMRRYYNTQVVAKARQSGALTPRFDHHNSPTGIPLPATLVKDMSDLLQASDTSVQLVSPFPWPHRAGRQMDEFQTEAWAAFQKDPASIVSRELVEGGRRVLRVAIADRLSDESCVQCHNSDPLSPKHGWQVGDVRAVLEVRKVIEPYLASAEARSRLMIGGILAGTGVIGLILIVIGVGAERNIRARSRADAHSRFLTHHDALTGLLNRAAFLEELAHRLSRTSETPDAGKLALFLVDIDRFKEINEHFGQEVGDRLVAAAAVRLGRFAGEHDVLGRMAGDEIMLARMLPGTAADVLAFAEQLVGSMANPFDLGSHHLIVTASIGICLPGGSPVSAEDMLRSADLAMMRAKTDGRNRAMLYSPQLLADAVRHRELVDLIRKAARAEEFALHFQPIHKVQDGSLCGFEALLRLPSADGFVSPVVFIPIAEEIGAITAIGRWALRRACSVAASWPSELTVSVNLSPCQFAAHWRDETALIEEVRDALSGQGLAPHRLELEVTEGVLLESTERVIRQFESLRALGVTLAMDDFGTGYSSLGYLWRLPFDKLKIDRSIVSASIEGTAAAVEVLSTVIGLSKALRMAVTAEGVESGEQVTLLERLGCDRMQGFFLAKPMPEADVAAYIQRCAEAVAGAAHPRRRATDRRVRQGEFEGL